MQRRKHKKHRVVTVLPVKKLCAYRGFKKSERITEGMKPA
jgi:hypothetical protein